MTTSTRDHHRSSVLDHLGTHRLLPVVVVDDPATAAPLATALVEGGLPVAEVAFRTAGAVDGLRRMADHPELCVGAGTVLTADQVDAAVDAGARFVVSPGLDEGVVRRCAELDVLAIPGVATATEITDALALGITVTKLFPAAQLGGPQVVHAMAGPFPQMRFVPTGGIGADTAPDYLAHPSVLAVGGSWMVPAEAVARGDVDRVTGLVRQAVAEARAGGGTDG